MIKIGKRKKNSQYIRAGIHSTQEVFRLVSQKRSYVNDVRFDWDSQRYEVFKKSLRCVSCGIIGNYFALEKSPHTVTHKFHFNLYAVNKHGHEILMTKDHIIPKSKGGSNTVANYQTMCTNCNARKGNKIC